MLVMAYIACKNQEEAESIGKKLVEEKLIACANVIPSVASTFSWNGETQTQNEALLILKTLKRKMDAVEERVRQLHSYDVPCIAFYPAVHANAQYVKWVETVVS
ncbi:divalent-cation tolerance protein CutA [Candidatus Micrarchaeota archaeon]|nr:divalent-cation tolerance protein CutA [Candidatus Micrarchaeota archaeon]